jgi:hypothetical protein
MTQFSTAWIADHPWPSSPPFWNVTAEIAEEYFLFLCTPCGFAIAGLKRLKK